MTENDFTKEKFADDVEMVRGLLVVLEASNSEAMMAKSIVLDAMSPILMILQENAWALYDVEKDEAELGRRMLVYRELRDSYAELVDHLRCSLDTASNQLDEELELIELKRLLDVAGRKLWKQTKAFEVLHTCIGEVLVFNAELYAYVNGVSVSGFMDAELAERLRSDSHKIHELAEKLLAA